MAQYFTKFPSMSKPNMNFVNKYLFLCFAWNSVLYSSELAEYCIAVHPDDNLYLELLTSDSSIVAKIEKSDSLKCYDYEHERKNIIYLPENLMVSNSGGYEARGCSGTSGDSNYESAICLVTVGLNIPITFPKKIFICKQLKPKDVKSLFGKTFPAEWKLNVKCDLSDTTYSGSYFIRITGECK